ncbi:hypothetical protein [Vibrio sp. Hal054]|uniref:hypothetical protein n=1 Tax=Vibrio sp. Hal054 TaxID=3035158 RepID=UPI00301DE53A
MEINSNLSPEQAKFALWVSEKMPYLEHIFDWSKPAYKPDVLESYLGVASHGQQIMARFVVGVWRNENQFGFDLITAVRTLDQTQSAIIATWVQNPFFP